MHWMRLRLLRLRTSQAAQSAGCILACMSRRAHIRASVMRCCRKSMVHSYVVSCQTTPGVKLPIGPTGARCRRRAHASWPAPASTRGAATRAAALCPRRPPRVSCTVDQHAYLVCNSACGGGLLSSRAAGCFLPGHGTHGHGVLSRKCIAQCMHAAVVCQGDVAAWRLHPHLSTRPPLDAMRAASPGQLGLWSAVSCTAAHPPPPPGRERPRTARESPTHATVSCRPRRCATTAVLPLMSVAKSPCCSSPFCTSAKAAQAGTQGAIVSGSAHM